MNQERFYIPEDKRKSSIRSLKVFFISFWRYRPKDIDLVIEYSYYSV